jgi:SAM-dependent methyltransferase
MDEDRTHHYDAKYQNQNYFGYREWLYAPFVASLIAFCGLRPGASVLDVGCGQGFFSYLFSRHRMNVHGVDISETGIRTAQQRYGHLGITFSVADIHTAVFPEAFDCVFVRSCSLYNTTAFADSAEPTETLLGHLKPGGVFLFAYNSKFSSGAGSTWRYHSLDDARAHFGRYPNASVFFSNRIDTWLLRRHAFTPPVTRLNARLSELSGMGGDLVCVLRNVVAGERHERARRH